MYIIVGIRGIVVEWISIIVDMIVIAGGIIVGRIVAVCRIHKILGILVGVFCI